MIPDDGAPLFDESPTAHRILAIDDEIAALDRVYPKSRYLGYGAALLSVFLLWAVSMVVAGSSAAEALFLVIVSVTVPSLIFGLQLTRNRLRRRRLEQELDELIEHPSGRRVRVPRWEGSVGQDPMRQDGLTP